MPKFSAFSFEEFTTGWRVEIKIVHFDNRADTKRSRLNRRNSAAFRLNAPCMLIILITADDLSTGDRSNTGKCLTTEPQTGYSLKIIQRGDFTGCMAD